MTEDQIGALIAINGLLSQLAGAVLLVGLFAALLRSHPRPQPYFRQWTLGWVALVVALCGVAIQYALPRVFATEPLAARAANLVYQSGRSCNVRREGKESCFACLPGGAATQLKAGDPRVR